MLKVAYFLLNCKFYFILSYFTYLLITHFFSFNSEIQNRPANISLSRYGQTILFSSDTKLVNAHKDQIILHQVPQTADQDVLCINERQVMIRTKSMYDPPPISGEEALRNRPTTSYIM